MVKSIVGKLVQLTIALIILLTFIFSGFLVYEFGGLKYFIKALLYINGLPLAEKVLATDELFGKKENLEYGGIFAGTWQNEVCVWGRTGLLCFTTDENSTFSYFNGCIQSILNPIDLTESNNLTVPRQIFFNPGGLEKWKSKVKTGDFVTVVTTDKAGPGVPGNLKEILASDWWSFMQSDMKTECAK